MSVTAKEVQGGLFMCVKKTGADRNICRLSAGAWADLFRDNKTGHELLGGDDRVEGG